MKKSLNVITLALVMLMPIACTDYNDVRDDETMKIENNPPTSVTDLCNQLYESYLPKTRTADESDYDNYPDYFGGCYIDNDKVVVLIKGDIEMGKQKIYKQVGVTPLIEFRKCLYSFHEISALKDEIGKIYRTNESLKKRLGWTSVGKSIKENKVIVYLENCSETHIKAFKERVSDSEMIVFEELSNIIIFSNVVPDSIR